MSPLTPGVYFSSPEREPENIESKRREFVPVEQLFPNWHTAGTILTSFCEKTGDWIVEHENGDVTIRPDFPMVKDELSGEMVPMGRMFPPEDIPKVEHILVELGRDYMPDLEEFRGEKIDDEMKYHILYKIKDKEHQIIQCGGRSFKDEMKFRLGVCLV